MSYDITTFGLDDMRRCAADLREALAGAETMEVAAGALCRRLFDLLRTPGGERACAMVRCYKTHPYGALPADLRRFAKRALGAVAISPPEPEMPCLTLLATVGDEAEWNDRRASAGHQAIPLPSPHIVERAPMIAQLFRELGVAPTGSRGAPDPGPARRVGATAGRFGVFHVEAAAGSPYIPAQAGFVDRFGIRSVLGFGGRLPSGETYAAILFARVAIPVGTADRFRTLAADVGGALAAHEARVFEDAPAAEPDSPRA